MKRVLMIIVSIVMAFSVCSCGKKTEPPEQVRPTQAPIANGSLAFSVINKLGSSINEIYVSQTTSDDWGENLLGDERISDGGAFEVRFSPEQAMADTTYDIAVITSKAGEYHFENMNLNGISVVTLSINEDDEVIAELD